MRIVIIGDGIAGQSVAEKIRKEDNESEIFIFTKEPYSFYSRIFLPLYIIGERSLDKLILRNREWYKKNDILLFTNNPINHIDPEKKLIYPRDPIDIPEPNLNSDRNIYEKFQSISYDKLVFATGSNPRRFSFGNPNIDGMFTLRNIDDANQIREFINKNNVKNVVILGGGLLGIELGFHLLKLDLSITICELSSYLLHRQLDEGTAKLLQKYLEHKGLRILCGEKAEKVIGKEFVEGIQFESGKVIKCQMILQQMGIIPDTFLAQKTGLKVELGIIVNEYMQTSESDIYAAGDCIQFNKRIWGIIPASMEQAQIAANHILGKEISPYQGTIWNTKLKIAGISLSCMGTTPPNISSKGKKIIQAIDPENYICKKILVEESKLTGAILMGSSSDKFFRKNLGKKVDLEELKRVLNISNE
ncbi:MAG: FAD-dependent oxidoreductase [Candidatus Lokiarchaeota archaeon]|nr:FAD-dependent oxidoreductase [Candidatus Harpocratesius repetitus]